MVMKLRRGRRRQSLWRRRRGRRAESWRSPTSHQSPPSPRLEESSPHIPPPSTSPPSTAVKSEIRIQNEVQYYNVYNGVTTLLVLVMNGWIGPETAQQSSSKQPTQWKLRSQDRLESRVMNRSQTVCGYHVWFDTLRIFR